MVYYLEEGVKIQNPIKVWSYIYKNKNKYKLKYILMAHAHPIMSRVDFLKNRSYPGLLNAIRDIKKLEYAKEGLKQLRGFSFDKVGDALEHYRLTGELKYAGGVNIRELFEKDVTPKDCHEYQKWVREVAIPLCQEKVKELKGTLNEATIEELKAAMTKRQASEKKFDNNLNNLNKVAEGKKKGFSLFGIGKKGD